MDSQIPFLMLLITAVVGIAILLPGLFWFRRNQSLTRKGRRAQATVIREDTVAESSFSTVEVEFIDDRGRKRRVWLEVMSNPGIDEAVVVLYNPLDPSSAVTAEPAYLLLNGVSVLVMVGGMFVLGALFFLLMFSLVGVTRH
jgi:hypothetical protein